MFKFKKWLVQKMLNNSARLLGIYFILIVLVAISLKITHSQYYYNDIWIIVLLATTLTIACLLITFHMTQKAFYNAFNFWPAFYMEFVRRNEQKKDIDFLLNEINQKYLNCQTELQDSEDYYDSKYSFEHISDDEVGGQPYEYTLANLHKEKELLITIARLGLELKQKHRLAMIFGYGQEHIIKRYIEYPDR